MSPELSLRFTSMSERKYFAQSNAHRGMHAVFQHKPARKYIKRVTITKCNTALVIFTMIIIMLPRVVRSAITVPNRIS